MKLRKIIILAILAITIDSYGQSSKNQTVQTVEESGQTTFIVDDFSDRYFGKVFLTENETSGDVVEGSGWIVIFDKETNRQLIKVENDQIFIWLHKGKVRANIAELPYGEQSIIMYSDFNFDDKADFAIMNGRYSCYGGPSFEIYLATDKGFEYSEDFTHLAQDYCGMFHLDYDEKQISTMTKSGCCWHQYSTFVVEDNRPVAIKIVEEGLNMAGVWDIVEQKRVNGKMITQEYSVLNTNEKMEVIYSFEFSNKKKMKLLAHYDKLLYIFTNKDDKIELYIWDEVFHYSKKDNMLEFENEGTTYKIISSGIIVNTANKKYDMKALPETIKGSLTDILEKNFENVTVIQ